MKVMAFNEARAGLKQAMETAQEDSVLITVHGKPAAMLVGVRGQSFDDLYTKSPEFWRMIQERQQSTKSYSIEEVRAELAQQVPGARTVKAPRRTKTQAKTRAKTRARGSAGQG
jgi:prevent-host-death family protein